MVGDNLAQHLTLDLANCNVDKLTNLGAIYTFLLGLPKIIGMETITLPYVVRWLDKGSKIAGVSGFTMIATSHISLHTFPDKKFMYADVFSCKNFHINRTIALFLETFEAKQYKKNVVKR